MDRMLVVRGVKNMDVFPEASMDGSTASRTTSDDPRLHGGPMCDWAVRTNSWLRQRSAKRNGSTPARNMGLRDYTTGGRNAVSRILRRIDHEYVAT